MPDQRFEEIESDAAAGALCAGLEQLAVPPLSADFDARLLEALRSERPWWHTWSWSQLWRSVRPVAAGALCSGCAMVALFYFAVALPDPQHPAPRAAPGGGLVSLPALDGAALTTGTLRRLVRWSAPNPGIAVPAPRKPAAVPPGRRSSLPRDRRVG